MKTVLYARVSRVEQTIEHQLAHAETAASKPISSPSSPPYNFAKHLKALQWRTPFKTIVKPGRGTRDPSLFKINPHHLIPGPNI